METKEQLELAVVEGIVKQLSPELQKQTDECVKELHATIVKFGEIGPLGFAWLVAQVNAS